MARKKTYEEKIADHIAAVVEDRKIEDVLHFTRLENLPGILKHGLRDRTFAEQADYNIYVGDAVRRDGNDGAISVSISCFYPKMFAGKRYSSGNNPWVILVLDPRLLSDCRCRFYRTGVTTNATKYEKGKRNGGFALLELFEDCSITDLSGTGFRAENGLPSSWPTSSDAEVQVMDPIHPDYLLAAWVETPEHGERVREAFDACGRSKCEVLVQSFEPRISRKPYSWG